MTRLGIAVASFLAGVAAGGALMTMALLVAMGGGDDASNP